MLKRFDDFDPHAASLACETLNPPPEIQPGDAVTCVDAEGALRDRSRPREPVHRAGHRRGRPHLLLARRLLPVAPKGALRPPRGRSSARPRRRRHPHGVKGIPMVIDQEEALRITVALKKKK